MITNALLGSVIRGIVRLEIANYALFIRKKKPSNVIFVCVTGVEVCGSKI